MLSALLQSLREDCRFALRYFARHKATSAIIVAVLALGTGANTLIFSIFQAEFLRPPPAMTADPARAQIWAQQRTTLTGAWDRVHFSGTELSLFSERRDVFQAVAAWTTDDVILTGGDSVGALNEEAQFVTPNYFTTLGVPVTVGQGLRPAPPNEAVADLTAVMSHVAAEQLYGSAAAAVGRTVLVNEVPVQVIGVGPPRFQGARKNMNEPALWIPLSARAEITGVSYRWFAEDASLFVFGRLAPGASLEQATALAQQVVASTLPDSAARVGMARSAEVVGLHAPPPGNDSLEVVFAFTMMAALGILVLVVACMNVSSLMVAAAVSRRHEIAVRLALGASRLRLIRQLVTESTVLAVVGGTAGLTLAYWVLTWMARKEIDGVDVVPDVGTFAFVLVMAILTGILFGLSPALHATRGGVANVLRDSGGGATHRSRLQRGLVIGQIALSQPLLVLLGAILALVISDFKPLAPEMSREVVAAVFRPLDETESATLGPQAVAALIPRIADRQEVLAVVPAAEAFDIRGIYAGDRPLGAADTVPTVMHLEGVAPGWFGVLDVPILLGRDVSLADTASSDRPVVVGADLVKRLWGDANPIGRRLTSPTLSGWGQDSIAMTIVGVYDQTARVPGMLWSGQTARTNVPYRVYTAHGKRWQKNRILVRTRGPAAPHLTSLQQFAMAEAPSLPVFSMRTLAQMDETAYEEILSVSAMAGAAGIVALLLASLGLYGVIALSVRQRTREIGVRIAVGARPMRVALMFLSAGVRTSLIGLAIGLPLSLAAMKIAISRGVLIIPGANLYVVGGAIAVLLVTVAAAATWGPARRASLVDPAIALRAE